MIVDIAEGDVASFCRKFVSREIFFRAGLFRRFRRSNSEDEDAFGDGM